MLKNYNGIEYSHVTVMFQAHSTYIKKTTIKKKA